MDKNFLFNSHTHDSAKWNEIHFSLSSSRWEKKFGSSRLFCFAKSKMFRSIFSLGFLFFFFYYF